MITDEQKLKEQLLQLKLDREKQCLEKIQAVLAEYRCEFVNVPDVRINGKPIQPTVRAK